MELSQRELRGVPLVGGRRSSAIPGTDPLPALLSKEQRGKFVMVPLEPSVPTEVLSVHYERRGAPLHTRGTREAGRFFKGR